MAEILDRHHMLAHQAFMMGELHGREELKKAIAQAIADAEERGRNEGLNTKEPNSVRV
jgi:hypothetical protein